MNDHNHLCASYHLMRFMMRKLRYELLMEPEVKNKIRLCELIHDCAASIEEIYKSGNVGDFACPEFTIDSFNSSLIFEITKFSLKDDISRTLLFLKILDAQTKYFRSKKPKVCNLIRRTIESISVFYTGLFPSLLDSTYLLSNSHFEGQTLCLINCEVLPWSVIPSKPARDIEVSDCIVKQSKDDSTSNLSCIHGQIYGIEIPAAEVCSVIPLVFPDLPIELDISLAKQTYDEGRHARILLNFFLSAGGKIDDHTNGFRIWDNVLSGNTLAEMICIEHVLGEGYALGYDVKAIHDYQKKGMDELANIHSELHEDEVIHVSNGLAWFNYLAKDNADSIIAGLEESYAVVPPSDPFFSEDIRRSVGFSEKQIHRQRELSSKSYTA